MQIILKINYKLIWKLINELEEDNNNKRLKFKFKIKFLKFMMILCNYNKH